MTTRLEAASLPFNRTDDMNAGKRIAPFAFLLSSLCLANDFFQTIPLEDFPEIYSIIQHDNLSQIINSSANGTVSNVFPVFVAGHIHSPLAVSALLERIEWPGQNDPIRHYYQPPEPMTDSGIQHVRLSPISRFPRPPTPAVAALTQSPVTWQTLQSELENVSASTRKVELLAWVAAATCPSNFFPWLSSSLLADTNRWSGLASYASTNLVGRRPFDVSSYNGYSEYSLNEPKQLYDNCVRELRRRASEALLQNDMVSVHSISNVLHTMGQPVIAPTWEEEINAIEQVPEEEIPDGITDIEELILD